MRKTLLILALMAATSAQAANLSEIYLMARKNDAVYASAYAAYQAGLEKLPQGRALLFPSVDFGAGIRHTEADSSISAGTQSYNSHGFTLALTQPIYRKQNLETLQQAKLQVVLAEQQLKLAGLQLILRVAQAYFDVLQAQDDVTTAQAQKTAIAEQLALAKRSFEVGAATIVDTHEAQARYNATEAQEIAALNELEVKRRALEKLIGAEAPKLAALSEPVAIPLPQPNDMATWVRQAEGGSVQVAASLSAAEIARREIAKQRAGYYPTLDLAASYSDNQNGSFGTTTGIDTQSAVIGLELGWNLYQGGATSSRVREAVANLERARFDLDNARRQAALDTRQAFLGVISGDARVTALQQAVTSSEVQLKSTKLGMEVGVRTGVDVLNAQQQLYSAQRDLAAARYSALLSGLNLKAVAGSLSEADLAALDTLLK